MSKFEIGEIARVNDGAQCRLGSERLLWYRGKEVRILSGPRADLPEPYMFYSVQCLDDDHLFYAAEHILEKRQKPPPYEDCFTAGSWDGTQFKPGQKREEVHEDCSVNNFLEYARYCNGNG